MSPADRIAEAHQLACNAKSTVEGVEMLLDFGRPNAVVPLNLARVAMDQLGRVIDQLQPFVDGEMAP